MHLVGQAKAAALFRRQKFGVANIALCGDAQQMKIESPVDMCSKTQPVVWVALVITIAMWV
jgi:hypothetical protein